MVGPNWVGTARFDINARAEREAPPEVMADMLKRLLADRFGLRVHTEPREIDVYVLTLARTDGRLGPGLRTSTADCHAVEEARKKAAASGAPPTPSGPPKLGARPVLARTGLTGRWDVELQFSCPAGLQVASDRPDAPVSVFTAVQEQLGLKLEAWKERMDVLVIDQVALPTAN